VVTTGLQPLYEPFRLTPTFAFRNPKTDRCFGHETSNPTRSPPRPLDVVFQHLLPEVTPADAEGVGRLLHGASWV
jgi:hypothetical protein